MRWRTWLIGTAAFFLILVSSHRAHAWGGPFGGYGYPYGGPYYPWSLSPYGYYGSSYPYVFYSLMPLPYDARPICLLDAEYEVNSGGYEAISYVRILGAHATLVTGAANAAR